MPAMLILDKTQALDRMIAASIPLEVPEQFVRSPYRIAVFERVDVPVGAPALVLAQGEPAPLGAAAVAEIDPSPAVAPPQVTAPAHVLAWRVPHALSWPAFTRAFALKPES